MSDHLVHRSGLSLSALAARQPAAGDVAFDARGG
jgi:hypothetical protein